MEVFDKIWLRQALQALPLWKRVAFMVLICERMLPNYRTFSSESNFGDVSVLRHSLDEIWDYIRTGEISRDVRLLKEACEQQAPNTELFCSNYTSAALDVVTSICIILDVLDNQVEEGADDVAALAVDTVDIFIQQAKGLNAQMPNFEQSILSNPLMQRELCLQREDLDFLISLPENGREEVLPLRNRSENVLGSLG